MASILHRVNLNRSRILLDFGRGFYTTTSRDQATDYEMALQTRFQQPTATIEFTVERNQLADVDCLFFVRAHQDAHDYWSFVDHCLTVGGHNRTHAAWYDIVVGPVVASRKKQTFVPRADQISFHTPNAVAVLNNLPLARKRRLP